MNISFDGINESVITFFGQGDIKPGDLVSVCQDDTVKKSVENSNFIGICISYKCGIVAVQTTGFATIKVKNLSTTTYGRQYFVADEDATLKLSESTNPAATPLNVISIDKTSSTVGVFL